MPGHRATGGPQTPARDSFQISGRLATQYGPVVGKKVWALQVNPEGEILMSFAVAGSGLLAPTSPAAVTDSDGVFTLELRRDYALRTIVRRLIVLCWDPGLAGVRFRDEPLLPASSVLVSVIDHLGAIHDVNGVEITFGRSTGSFIHNVSMQPGERSRKFKLFREWVTLEGVGNGYRLTLEPPRRSSGLEVTSLITDHDGYLVWDRLTTSPRTKKAIQWEAVLENGWVEGYRMLNIDIVGLQGQKIRIPTPSWTLLEGKVEGDKVLVVSPTWVIPDDMKARYGPR